MIIEELHEKDIKAVLRRLHEAEERLKILEGIEAERKKREEYEEQCCDECGIIPDDSGNCMCDEDDDDDYYETDYDREGV